jgi:hypothetical protein
MYIDENCQLPELIKRMDAEYKFKALWVLGSPVF